MVSVKGSILLVSLVKFEREFPQSGPNHPPDTYLVSLRHQNPSIQSSSLSSFSFSFDLMYMHSVSLNLLQYSTFCFVILPVNLRLAAVILPILPYEDPTAIVLANALVSLAFLLISYWSFLPFLSSLSMGKSFFGICIVFSLLNKVIWTFPLAWNFLA